MRKTILLLALILLVPSAVLAQALRTITGVVTDEAGEPVIAATVYIEETNKAVYTDANGHYTIQAQDGQTVIFSFIGFERQSRKVKGDATINIIMKEDENTRLADVVVVGYSTMERRDLTGSVSSVKLPEDKPFLSIDQMLAGQAPGVFVNTSSGNLGSANLMTIRGISSILGDNNPLYVIDGVPIYSTDRDRNLQSTDGGSFPGASMSGGQVGGGSLINNRDVNESFEKNPLLSLNPDDIESIEILKDAFSTAIYGSRGSAGVILITTKKGARGKAKVNVNYTLSVENPLDLPNMLNGDEYAAIYSSYYPNGNYPTGYNTDWLDAVTRTAVSHAVSASVSGGTENTNYFISMSYNNNQSYIINNDLERYSARASIDTKLSDRWKMGVSMSLSKINNNSISASNVFAAAIKKAPNLLIYDENGDYHYGYSPNSLGDNTAYNPVAMAYEDEGSMKDIRVIGNAYLEWNPISWLSLRSEIGTDISNSTTLIRKADIPVDLDEVSDNQASETTNMDYRVVINNTLNVTKAFGDDHFIQGVIGQSYEYSNERVTAVTGSNFFSSELIGVGAAETTRVQQAERQKWALFSAFARLNYQWKHRYMFGATYRVDGSSRYNRDHRYLGTPSVSVGWRMSEEKFIRDNLPWVDEMKLRASVGWSSKDGNNNYYGAQAVYTLSDINYGGHNYLMMSQPGNEDLNWERTITYDVGLDLTLLKNRLDITLDYYYKKTTDMLFASDLPGYTGYENQDQNIADMMNSGFELQVIATPVQTRDFTWQAILNLARSRNKILKLNFEGTQITQLNSSDKYYAEGHPAAQWYLHEWAGVDPETGNPLWRYADGTLSTTPPAADGETSDANKKVCGTALPDFYGGFTNNLTWKNWELDMMFTFSVGSKMINATKANLLTYTTNSAYNLDKDILTMWQVPGQKTDIPKLDHASIINSYDYSLGITTTRFLENNSYLRLKTLQLTYNVPKRFLQRTKFFNSFKIYAAMTNVFTITGYSGLDPEVSAFGSSAINAGYDYLTMPQTRSYQFGIRASF